MTHPIDQLLIELADQLGTGPLQLDDDGATILVFDGIEVILAREADHLLVFAKLGEAPDDNIEFVEALLAANLFWRETGGATLSLEPHSRLILLATRLAVAEIESVDHLELQIETFALTVQAWQQTVNRLRDETGHAEQDPQLPAYANLA